MTRQKDTPEMKLLQAVNDLALAMQHLNDATHAIGDMVFETSKYIEKQDKRTQEILKAVERLETKP